MSTENIDTGKNIFGSELRRIRKERRLSLDELGKKLDLSYTYIQKIEKGDREPSNVIKEKLEAWIATGETPKFAVTKLYEPETKKAEHTPLAEAILGVTDKLSPEKQAEALQFLIDLFISEQKKAK